MKTKTVQLPGESQEDVDAELQARLTERERKLAKRTKAERKATLQGITRAAEKNPRRDVEKVRVEREKRSSGLRF